MGAWRDINGKVWAFEPVTAVRTRLRTTAELKYDTTTQLIGVVQVLVGAGG